MKLVILLETYETETVTSGLCYTEDLIFLENNIVWFWNSLDVQSSNSSGELTTFCTSFNSKEIVNIQGLFVLTVGYIDMTAPPLTKYYYIIERAYFIYNLFILFISTLSFLMFLYTLSWKYNRDYLHASKDYFVLYYVLYF